MGEGAIQICGVQLRCCVDWVSYVGLGRDAVVRWYEMMGSLWESRLVPKFGVSVSCGLGYEF